MYPFELVSDAAIVGLNWIGEVTAVEYTVAVVLSVPGIEWDVAGREIVMSGITIVEGADVDVDSIGSTITVVRSVSVVDRGVVVVLSLAKVVVEGVEVVAPMTGVFEHT